MAVLGRVLIDSAERIDLVDLLSIDSFVAGDFKYLIKSFVGDIPYVLKGFDVIDPGLAINTGSLAVRVANSVLYYPNSAAGSFFVGLDPTSEYAQPLVPNLRPGTTNYVYLVLSTFDTAQDNRAFWDVEQNGGQGAEFNQSINTESVLSVDIGVSISGFPEGTLPVCEAVMSSNSKIVAITDRRDMMFRLGTGDNPFSTYTWRPYPDSTHARLESPGTIVGNTDPNPFQGGDKNIYTLKEWMDATMSTIKEIKGSSFWYDGSVSTISLKNLFNDTLATNISSKGQWTHDINTAGLLSWTEDIHIKNLNDPRDMILRGPGSITISTNDQVAYLALIRNKEFNDTQTTVQFYNNQPYVNGTAGAFTNVAIGDWIKKGTDSENYYVRVEGLHTQLNGVGPLAANPALAVSLSLGSPYLGSFNTASVGVLTRGQFTSSDVQYTQRDDSALTLLGGNLFWLAYRSDTDMSISDITSTTLSVVLSDGDGIKMKGVSVAHGLIDGDRINVTVSPLLPLGIYVVEVVDSDTFYISTPLTTDTTATADYAIVTTSASTTLQGFPLESANHGFKSNEKITITGTSLYDADFLINVRSATTFQIAPVAAGQALTGNAKLVRINVKTEFGPLNLIQGADANIGEPETQNLLTYIGMPSLNMVKPTYHVTTTYNALWGAENYNCAVDDDLTMRAAKLTAMMADRVHDRSINFIGRINLTNTQSGANQVITSTGNLTLLKPSTPSQTINLSNVPALATNMAVVINLTRNGSSTITPILESLTHYIIEENKFILFYRLSDTAVRLWDGRVINNNCHLNTDYPEDAQNRNVYVNFIGKAGFDYVNELLVLNLNSKPEVNAIKVLAATAITAGSYFTLSAANNATNYYVWFKKDGSGTNPSLVGKTGIEVDITTGWNASQVAAAMVTAFLPYSSDFNVSANADIVTVGNTAVGATSDIDEGLVPTGFNFTIMIQGCKNNIDIIIPGSANNVVDALAINTLGTLVIPDGSSAWVRINRNNAKTFNVVETSDVPDTDLAGAIYVTPTSQVPIDQDVIILWSRIGDYISSFHQADPGIQGGDAYEEWMDINSPILANSYITIPYDSHNSNSIQYYIVGTNMLNLYLNGELLRQGAGHDWLEVGADGQASIQIQILQDLFAGDVLCFKQQGRESVFFANPLSAGIAPTMQETYISGRIIDINSGQPIEINGPSGEKLLKVHGDMDIDGLLHTMGVGLTPQASSPFPNTDYGIWMNTNGNLMLSTPTNPDVIIKGANGPAVYLTNLTGSTILANTPVCVDASGNLKVIDPTNEDDILSIIGLVQDDTLNNAVATVISSGLLTNITGFNNRDSIWLSHTGGLTSTKPNIGSGGFLAGDFIVRIGTVVKNSVNPTLKDFLINMQIMGQL